MGHTVYVDLSAKVEHWTLASAVAVCNGGQWVCYVSGKAKQRARRALKERHGSRHLQYRVLALLIYVAIRERLAEIEQVVIDRDYAGEQAEATIKNLLLALVRRERPETPAAFVRFENVKGSAADLLAKQVFDGKAPAGRVLSFAELVGHF